MIKIGIIGGTGYTGVELLRLLAAHAQADLRVITSRGEAGKKVAELFPSLRGHLDLAFSAPDPKTLAGCDVVFSATPNGVAMTQARALLQSGVKLIDLAADFRLSDAAVWKTWYGMPHACPELLAEAVYGLPEMNRDRIKTARLIANPGCYPTAVQLGFLPLLEQGLVDTQHLIADAKSGVSGAGKKIEADLLFCEAADNMKAYAVPGHRHLPEICQGLDAACGTSVKLTFVPHLTPMIRGIHATLYARLTKPGTDLQALFEQRYAREPFVDVMPPGSHPETRAVRAANHCRLAVHQPQGGDIVVVLSVIDNLVKGAAGQAVQNMNILFGLDERTGLDHPAVLP
ncbi:MAG: N-acetyl-gamma-glutamyl-phosphate reductase [Sulfuricaulis sp.]|uniref:N-acetyl-gamma-glutamyl-phosphate reductase n=1 Tax=Sulfuricaulis sp. TaxID=2003553 RepID=UPI0034A31F03